MASDRALSVVVPIARRKYNIIGRVVVTDSDFVGLSFEAIGDTKVIWPNWKNTWRERPVEGLVDVAVSQEEWLWSDAHQNQEATFDVTLEQLMLWTMPVTQRVSSASATNFVKLAGWRSASHGYSPKYVRTHTMCVKDRIRHILQHRSWLGVREKEVVRRS